jgi:acyl transferase domain-containing protein/thioesterase domain-containing protein/acyl carrier protein
MDKANDIAVVGLAAHLPGAADAQQFWQNLRAGVESVRSLTDEELELAGVGRDVSRRAGYVRAAGTLGQMEYFDGDFFGFSPRDAAIMDPQHRHFLECCWEAMEDAAHVPDSFDGAIGVFAGCGANSYYMFNLLSNDDLVRDVGLFLLRHTGNDKDFLATRASYTFDLTGPSVSVQTACSTSLVAVHLACQHLLSGECDMALAGGATIEIPHGQGYQYNPGEVLSPDGHCRAFDKDAQGTVFGSGSGVVVLRRLQDALDDGDHIYAVIKGSAVNNDGAQKVGYLAPSVDGQANCIAEALAVADVDASSLSYIECHGTGTLMGDPIEISALTQAFQLSTDKTGFCAIGSVKTNIGHLDTAAGVASLIKVSLALTENELPASLNFTSSNPNIDFDASPFFVNDRLRSWEREGNELLRAGVNSLGVGGTNAFAVLEEPPRRSGDASNRPWHLLTISGKNRAALDANTRALADHLRNNPGIDLGDVAWTLQVGRKSFTERRVVAVRDIADAIAALDELDPRRVYTHSAPQSRRSMAFLFPGGGAQHPRMAYDLYRSEPVFAHWIDRGLQRLRETHGIDLTPLLLSTELDQDAAVEQLELIANQLPAIFLVEYALAQLLSSWGMTPTALLGHSLGENTAACVAGTMTFDDCLGLIVLRSRLCERAPGRMVVVPLTEEELSPMLERLELDLGVVNAEDLCVASGSADKIAQLEQELEAMGVEPQPIKIGVAGHSRLLDGCLDEFRAYLRSIVLSPPQIPWVSNETGTWITESDATDPEYWVRHLRGTVRFSDCVATLAADPNRILVEVGPGRTLSTLAKLSPAFNAFHGSIPTLGHAGGDVDQDAAMLTFIGRMWSLGAGLDTERLYDGEQRLRIPLPTYGFQKQRYFIDPGTSRGDQDRGTIFIDREEDEARWFWAPKWKTRDGEEPVGETLSWLVIRDETGLADDLVTRLHDRGDQVVSVRIGDSYLKVSDDEYIVAPEHGRAAFDSLVRDLVRSGRVPDRIAHLALLATDDHDFRHGSSFFHRNQELGFYSLLFLAQAWSAEGVQRPLHISVATAGAQRAVESDRVPWPEQATVLGPVQVIPREFPEITVSCFDIDPRELVSVRGVRKRLDGLRRTHSGARSLGERVLDEMLCPPESEIVALRGGRRLVREYRRIKVPDAGEAALREGGVVLITGGLGGIGLTIARHLAGSRRAKLALLSRYPLPDPASWDQLAARHGADHPIVRRVERIRELEQSGAEVMIVQGDVTDLESMKAVRSAIQDRFGALHGVIHAAGVVDDDLIVLKEQENIDHVLAPKVYGTLILDQIVEHDDLDLFVVFSSTSTATAPVGQVDYVAANAFLNAFAESRSLQRRRVLALNWGVWKDVGIAARAMAAGSTTTEAQVHECSHPMFDHMVTDGRGVTTFTSHWAPESEWYLDEHRTGDGGALLAGAAYPELARAALGELGIEQTFAIEDLTFVKPLAVADGETAEIVTRLKPTAEGYDFEVLDLVEVPGSAEQNGPAGASGQWHYTCQGSLRLAKLQPVPRVDIEAIEAVCSTVSGLGNQQLQHLRFGPRWDVVRRQRIGDNVAIARLELNERYESDLDSFGLHPALVDLGTGFAMDLIPGYTGGDLWVPVSYRAIRIHRKLPRHIRSIVSIQPGSSETSGFATFDIRLTDIDGEVCVEADGFTIKRLDGQLDRARGAPVQLDLSESHESARDQHTGQSLPEMIFEHNVEQGISEVEGVRVFERATSSGVNGVMYVTSLDLIESIKQTDESAKTQTDAPGSSTATSFSRPQLDSEYVAPRNDVERTLVTMWQELLGVDQIGVDDNFFDLGGHSLNAVRLFAKVRKTFGADFPISVLFAAPTIAAIAAMVGGGSDSDSDQPNVAAAVPQLRYRYLVPMNNCEIRDATPLFVVAGMYGNVLNFRHLAHQVAPNRPFFGIQAEGLFGGAEPHRRFEDMAAAYLTEVRQVQPHGPYLLGGFSGGGHAAYEMAQTLRAEGEEVSLLILLDTWLPGESELTRSELIRWHLGHVRSRGPAYVSEWITNRFKWEMDRRKVRKGKAPPIDPSSLHSQAVINGFIDALNVYKPKPYHGKVAVFLPPREPMFVFGPDRRIGETRRLLYEDNGWSQYCDDVTAYVVPGNHDSMILEPNVRTLATHLRAAVAAATEP